jgi:hypothetical protein
VIGGDPKCPFIYLNGYNVQRIVYELIKNWMLSNTPESANVDLAQTYDQDQTKSGIFLDVGYNFNAQPASKLPAVYVQRGAVNISSPIINQKIGVNDKESENTLFVLSSMPVKISCLAAAPIAVVENLAEYVKQPLLYFRKEIKLDFNFRKFQLVQIATPELIKESKDVFRVDLMVDTAFSENWVVKRDDLKLKTVSQVLFDNLTPGFEVNNG